ncbi:spore coat protein [Lottiidibacillus patelloidae]|uniref:Spore coat protein n=1 Tax=Lottiidibacillus patelloidae TaxID=2670334 RepID=A0A263BR82_9BACI|nr:CotH kinase family protein [Lottiidibacillus patelloidae]OZM56211.1 spore coat protein [Lottiidibacillus patelloidae]
MTNHNLPIYKVFIHPKDLSDLRKEIWSDEPVPAYLTPNQSKKKYDIDIVYRGSHIREFVKKSYHIKFYKPEFFHGLKEFHLNAEYKDPSMIRNKLSFDFFSSIGVLAPTSRHILLVINGKTEGVYLQLESVDEQFLTKRNIQNGAIFYAIDGDANFSLISDYDKGPKKTLDQGYEMKCGNEEDLLALQELIFKINTLTKDEFNQEIGSCVNIEKYLRWLTGITCTQNYDGFVHNYSLYRNHNTGLFEIMPWDYDATWGRDVNGKVMDYDYLRIQGFNTLTARILDNPIYRKLYCNILEEVLDKNFTIEKMQPKVERLHSLIQPAIIEDPYKKKDITTFNNEVEFILTFVRDRNSYIKSQMHRLTN